MATVGERDRARSGTVSRPRRDLESEYRQRETRKKERAAAGKAPKIEDATSMDEVLEAEREAGRREGTKPTKATPPTPATKTVAAVKAPAASTSASASSSASRGTSTSVPGVTAPMIFDVLIITADEIVTQHRAPVPSRLLVAFGLFGLLGLAKGDAARPAKVFAWGIVVATFYAAAPGNKPAALTALTALGNFLGGTTTTPAGGAGATNAVASAGITNGSYSLPATSEANVGVASAGITNGSYSLP